MLQAEVVVGLAKEAKVPGLQLLVVELLEEELEQIHLPQPLTQEEVLVVEALVVVMEEVEQAVQEL